EKQGKSAPWALRRELDKGRSSMREGQRFEIAKGHPLRRRRIAAGTKGSASRLAVETAEAIAKLAAGVAQGIDLDHIEQTSDIRGNTRLLQQLAERGIARQFASFEIAARKNAHDTHV